MKQTIVIFLLIFLGNPNCSFSEISDQSRIDSLLRKLDTTSNDSIRFEIYIDLLFTHVYYKPEQGLKYKEPALQIAHRINWKDGIARLKNVSGRLYWRAGNFDSALIEHFEMLRLSLELNNERMTALAYSNIGQDYGDAGKYKEASDNFKKALAMYEKVDDAAGQSSVLNLLSWTSTSLGNYAESSKYNYASLKLYEKLGDKEGIAIAISNIAEDQFQLGNYEEAITAYKNAIQLLLKIGDKINAVGSYNSIANIYKVKGEYPAAMENYLKGLQYGTEAGDRISIAVSNEGIGNVYSIQNKYADALNFYIQAAENYKAVNNKQELSRLYSAMGVCYSRMGKFVDAKYYFEDAKKLCDELKSIVSYSNYYQGKEFYDSLTGGWESAYRNYKQYIVIRDSIFNIDYIKKMLSSHMQYESEKEAAAKAEQDKKDIRQRTIRNSIASVLGGSLVFLVVVYRQRNRISKERKRSDELLLNILPAETAEELKINGTAKAKNFSEVTVLFTDFKNFTAMSEKLSAQELVNEINYCYSAFDNIITKYGIEKIKTIGDSYMCAGGLPVSNSTHATDIVLAALEIRDFVEEEKNKRINAGLPFFEIRIGCHSGPVVAGIVGIKKFAYDIWGDTVNIASRMESSGETGKINISGTTYELLKDNPIAIRLNCEHRGKIEAKNKGLIDMYFVERREEVL